MGIFWLIAGPNGVGKSTYAFRNLRAVAHTIHFVNLDEIARGLSPLEPQAAERDAARVALERCRAFMATRTSFAMETTLAGRTHFHLVDEAHAAGMQVNLQYFTVPSAEICLERIARRVAEGGHDVPRDVVLRRFDRSLGHVVEMTRKCDLWRIFEASTLPPKLALEGRFAERVFSDGTSCERLAPVLRRFSEAHA
jgi:predicted ABC-type ATPase